MKEIFENIRFLTGMMRPYGMTSLMLLLAGLAGVGLSLGSIALSKKAFDIAAGAVSGSLGQCLLLLALLFFCSIVMNAWVFRQTVNFQLRVRNELTANVFNHILRAEWLSAQYYHSGDVMSRVNTDISDWVQLISSTLPQFVITLFKLGSAWIFLFLLDKRLALLLALLLPLVLLLSKLYFRKLRKLSLEIKDTFSSVREFFQESVQHQGVVKALHLQSWFERQLDDRQDKYADRIRKHTRFSVFSNFVLSMGFTAGYCLSLAWGLFRMEAGEITFGTMTAFLQLVSMIQGPAAGLMGFVPTFITAYTATERLRELWTLPMEKENRQGKLEKVTKIRLEDVSFGYTPDKRVIDHLTLEFRPGLTALAGETGCGKTTIIRLVLGLITPEQGTVSLFDGVSNYPMSPSLRCNLAYVPQGGFLFSGTIRDNLRMGNPEASDEEMIRILKSVSADFVWNTREGLDTEIKEDGQGLSGGQIQRLALARALLSGGQVLLLDEATSALDEAIEADIMETLRKNIHDKIVIIVSHRRTVIESCDEVYRIK